jgi:MOSC domain-containing protein YiiM
LYDRLQEATPLSVRHLTRAELEAGLDTIRSAPRDGGVVEMIVRRPGLGEREVLDRGEVDVIEGFVGDTWRSRRNPHTPDGLPNPDAQVTIMGARAIALIAADKSRWPLAGDQLFVDLDLGLENLPAGTRLEIGSAMFEVSAEPHTGCGKFVQRFGVDAMKFVNSPTGRSLCLRGINAKVVQNGVIRVGDTARKRSVLR